MNLPKTYEPGEYEPNIYALWETSGAFSPSGRGEPYSVVMPPPNANASLHVGHSLEIIKDILIRFYRMRDRDAIYIPGSDHAGFETWVVFERALEAEGKSRFDFSRETLYNMVWDFVEKNRGDVELQIRALGASCDWNSTVFTLDKKVIDVVYTTFKKMWDEELIYRGERIVNFCTVHQTSFADIEVVFKEEKSHLWHVSYPLASEEGAIEVATTRPETMLGDVAIAVNPGDERYRGLVGQNVILPIVNKEIPVIADEAVDKDFGTGAVKVTPAHDSSDFEISQRHNLPAVQVIGYDGLMTANAPVEFIGLTIDEARKKALSELKKAGRLVKTEDYVHQVPHCYKCNSVIQPLLRDQWFVRVKPLAERAKQAIAQGHIKFTPASKADELIRYFDDLRDWNISRQIPWGIPIPAFQNVADSNDWVFDTRVDHEEIEFNGNTYRRDEDTFDTWFSSGQWPYIVTDVAQGGELKRFYPTSVMETGIDLLRPWVARMIMFGLYVTDQVPFHDVYFHGLVNDEKNQKMSKSKGNVINPMDLVAEYGSDALRMGIVANRSAGQSQAFSTATVVAGRNFCNKLWNIARFVEARISAGSDSSPSANLPTNWVLRQLDQARIDIEKYLSEYRFAEAIETIYHVIWDDVADWYIEASKQGADKNTLVQVLELVLKLTHPFAPFITETIWAAIRDDKSLLISAEWPGAQTYDGATAAEFDQIRELVSEIRYLDAQLPGGKLTLLYGNDNLIANHADLVKSLANLAEVKKVDQAKGLRIATAGREAWLDVSEATLYEHQTRLELRLVEARERVESLENRLNNPGYTDHAPAHLVEETRRELETHREQIERLERELEVIGS